jgi:hypothetical protein
LVGLLMSLICVRASCAAGISRIEWSLAFLSSLSYLNLSFPFRFDICDLFFFFFVVADPFLSFLVIACLLAFPPPRLVTNHHHQIAARLPNPPSTLLLRPTLNHQLRTSAIPSHPTHLKIPPTPNPSTHLPISASYLLPLPSTSESDTLDDGTFSAYSRRKVPRPLPCPHYFLSIFISKTPHIILRPISVEATRRLEC